MIEAQLVPNPGFFPGCCVFCMSQTGPIIDTRVERPALGRLYVCKRCVKQAAVLYGFAKGKRLDQLEHASRELEQAEKDISDRNEWVAERDDKIRALVEQLRQREEALEEALGEVKRLEHLAHDVFGAARDLAMNAAEAGS